MKNHIYKNKMKRIIIKYWWAFPVLLASLLITLGLLFFTYPSVLDIIVGIFLILTLIALPISWIVLIINKKWFRCLLSLTMSVLIVCVLWFPLVMASMSAPDGFGRSHPIPEGLAYHHPLSTESEQPMTIDSLDTETYLQVWEEFHGHYMYDLYYGALPAGDIYLRCYEATENIPLSEESILEESFVSRGATTSFTQLVSRKKFTIYEGDWDDYYAARIEVWHKDANTQKETKLLEKVYRVDGWMR